MKALPIPDYQNQRWVLNEGSKIRRYLDYHLKITDFLRFFETTTNYVLKKR